ncbi:MAG: glutamate dehydrogenase, partial [Gammaproteobacteria bacterium]
MTANFTHDGNSRLEAVIAMAKERYTGDRASLVSSFILRYYADTPAEELYERDPFDLFGAAVAHLEFAKIRLGRKPNVRVYNPTVDQHGWNLNRTVIEVVTDDMPFLVDSIRMMVSGRKLTTHLIIHPLVSTNRDAQGALLDIDSADDSIVESFLHFEIDRQTTQDALDDILVATGSVLEDVRAAVEDWQLMRTRMAEIIASFESDPPPINPEEIDEALEFLRWIHDHHFTFLGFREYALSLGPHGEELTAIEGSACGVLRGNPGGISASFAKSPREIRRFASEPSMLIITKANTRSTIHREGHLDYIGVKRFDATGTPIGEWRFLGLYTSAAYNQNPRAIPLLRHKLARAMQRSGYRENSHDAKSLLNILESFPRDLLFQISDDALFEFAVATVQLQDRQQVRLFIHPERYRRFVSCIVYVPRDRVDIHIHKGIQDFLGAALNGSIADLSVSVSEAPIARLYYAFRVGETGLPAYDTQALQRELEQRSRNWDDELRDALFGQFGDDKAAHLFRIYGGAFRADYRQRYAAHVAVQDIETMESLGDAPGEIAMSLHEPQATNDNPLRLKLFRAEHPIALFEVLPVLENMGLQTEDEHPSRIDRADASQLWLHDFGIDHREGADFDIEPLRKKFHDAFEKTWQGEVENDRLNGLVIRAGLDWRQIVVLRACEKYLRQVRALYSQDYIERTLLANPIIARLLVELFEHRFDPNCSPHERDTDALNTAIDVALDAVRLLDEDLILRRFRALIMAMLRTNFYQIGADGGHHTRLSFKFDPGRIAELPEPRPMYEIFVYSPRVEGVHMRGGPIARGGLRWSDRREDYRTEVLGLVKAQMVKNAVILPVGSKGGFFPKRLPIGDREAIQAEGIACYEIFIQGLLDLTDNFVAGKVVAASRTVRYDGDDTYLVVAADKGTASFSDIANQIAGDADFWLG